jgi:glucosamine-6-phosphate deaminase
MSFDPGQLREWLAIPTDELAARSRLPITVLDTREDVHRRFAEEMFDEIVRSSDAGEQLRVIVPVGPTGQYPLLAEMVNEAGVSLEHVTYFGMDQCLDWQSRPLRWDHPFNFEAYFHRHFLDRMRKELRPPAQQVIFPSVRDLDRSAVELQLTPAATTYGGFGFRGHIAFNEPPCSPWTRVTVEELRDSQTRIVPLAVDTLIAQAQHRLGGNVFGVPPMAVTLGMRELLSARRIRLYTDGGAWKQTILRILLFAEPTVDFPVTLVQGHPDVHVTVDAESATPPPEAWWGAPVSEARAEPPRASSS